MSEATIRTLKQLIEATGHSQREFAKTVGMSSAGLNQLVLKARFPKYLDAEAVITKALLDKGIDQHCITAAFDLLKALIPAPPVVEPQPKAQSRTKKL